MVKPMSITRIAAWALLLGVLIEALLYGVSLILFRFSYSREPMDDLFSWMGIMIHQPGVVISQILGHFTSGLDIAIIVIVQTLIWACFAFGILLWRTRSVQARRKGN